MTASSRSGFSLVEITLALGVAAFCLLAVFGMLPIGLKTQQIAIEQTAATRIISAASSDLRNTARAATASSLLSISIPPNTASSSSTLYFDTEGHVSPSISASARHRLTIRFTPNSTGGRGATFVHLLVTWPAAASITDARGSAETFVGLDRN
jgi:uncharacterized protein (TIGR02598 family)